MANQAAKQLIYASTGVALSGDAVLPIVAELDPAPGFGNIDPEVMANAQTYFWLSALSIPSWRCTTPGRRCFAPWATARCPC